MPGETTTSFIFFFLCFAFCITSTLAADYCFVLWDRFRATPPLSGKKPTRRQNANFEDPAACFVYYERHWELDLVEFGVMAIDDKGLPEWCKNTPTYGPNCRDNVKLPKLPIGRPNQPGLLCCCQQNGCNEEYANLLILPESDLGTCYTGTIKPENTLEIAASEYCAFSNNVNNIKSACYAEKGTNGLIEYGCKSIMEETVNQLPNWCHNSISECRTDPITKNTQCCCQSDKCNGKFKILPWDGTSKNSAIPTGQFKIVNRNSGLVISIDKTPGQSDLDHIFEKFPELVQWIDGSRATQIWEFKHRNGDTFTDQLAMVNPENDLYLNIIDESQEDCATVIAFPPTRLERDNQWFQLNWTYEKESANETGLYYTMTMVHSGKVLSVCEGSSTRGSAIVQEKAIVGAKYQQWKLVPVKKDNNI